MFVKPTISLKYIVAEGNVSAITAWPETSRVQTDLIIKIKDLNLFAKSLLRKKFVQQVFGFLLFKKIVSRSFLYKLHHVVGVLLHVYQESIKHQAHFLTTGNIKT